MARRVFSASVGLSAAPVVALLVTLAIACGSNSHTAVSGSVPPSIAGSWSVTLTQNGTTQSLFQTTLVSEADVNSADEQAQLRAQDSGDESCRECRSCCPPSRLPLKA